MHRLVARLCCIVGALTMSLPILVISVHSLCGNMLNFDAQFYEVGIAP